MASNPALLDRTVEEFRRTLTEIGGQPSSAGDAEVLGRRAAMVVLAGGAWERALGELLTSAEARILLGGISREALRKRVLTGSVLALRDDADHLRYPRWQFDAASSAPFAAVRKLNEIFAAAELDPWTLAAFATAPQPELDGRAPVDAFADPDVEPLLLSARRAVAELTRRARAACPLPRTTSPGSRARASGRGPCGGSTPPPSRPGSSTAARTAASTSPTSAPATWPRSRSAPSSRSSGACCGPAA
jgi:hypothetical protein